MFDALIDLLRFLFYLLAFLFFMMALPFIICHVAENWDAPEYPYSGFTPDCPTWEEQENTPCEGVASEPHGETRSPMPPTSELATRRVPRGEF